MNIKGDIIEDHLGGKVIIGDDRFNQDSGVNWVRVPATTVDSDIVHFYTTTIPIIKICGDRFRIKQFSDPEGCARNGSIRDIGGRSGTIHCDHDADGGTVWQCLAQGHP